MSHLIDKQLKFYEDAFGKHGDSPRSVHYNSSSSQYLRFEVLSKLFKYEQNDKFSIHEVGCGLGHYREYLSLQGINSQYSGSDISSMFIDKCKEKFSECRFHQIDMSGDLSDIQVKVNVSDYSTLSGTFNPIGDNSVEEWESFINNIIFNMFALSRKGIAFNFLTSYSQFFDENLYYADPGKMYNWLQKNLSRFITIISDVPLYEFTVLVYREEFIKEIFPDEFSKYFSD